MHTPSTSLIRSPLLQCSHFRKLIGAKKTSSDFGESPSIRRKDEPKRRKQSMRRPWGLLWYNKTPAYNKTLLLFSSLQCNSLFRNSSGRCDRSNDAIEALIRQGTNQFLVSFFEWFFFLINGVRWGFIRIHFALPGVLFPDSVFPREPYRANTPAFFHADMTPGDTGNGSSYEKMLIKCLKKAWSTN